MNLYNSIAEVWPENNAWYNYTHEQINKYILSKKNLFSNEAKILNAGSGGSTYDLPGEIYHVDLSEKLISQLPKKFVCSIERMPFASEEFGSVICVGSVINYCDAYTALLEMSRVLKPNGLMILEYERTESGELFFSRDYGKNIVLRSYEYNGQSNHNLWLYSDPFINSILNQAGFEILNCQYYHALSSIWNNLTDDEKRSGKVAAADKFFPCILKKHCAHNRIMLCMKK